MADEGLTIPKWILVPLLAFYIPIAPTVATKVAQWQQPSQEEAVEAGLASFVKNGDNLDFSTRQKISLAQVQKCDLDSLFEMSQSIPGPESPEPLPEPREMILGDMGLVTGGLVTILPGDYDFGSDYNGDEDEVVWDFPDGY